ncbi:plasma membrane ferric-chelate reductase Frp2 [Schizosaccharomyces pombe]|uniref:Ferric/cupric reductase transmembrane component 2 n=1 Tax=Schizosaccharomyces pombe (strain 972 / ATCC 24843) TaxID=284812 RepID=FRP2_SCHPO|nr:putative ferric-chelate reductase Frp2 [Schizosaccharomyces pombe]O94727.1 RecName: Full=Ferric/cupric reductase transmembrane component 2; AltName: Full=Ferric-chelate reductase 2 [Schizosaccharomyces pombe 972h-]CAA17033.1 ferric-chelate reductase Frp2 (predicted) [Schizosaccharomyces pombe]|eukprot:NP_595271.1 putative ferric-chelate reductase Frp2 [Schizosaccharomyces pombe]
MILARDDKWTLGSIALIFVLLIGFALLFLLERFRVKEKSRTFKDCVNVYQCPSKGERVYLALRHWFIFLATHKAQMTLILSPLVMLVTIPFTGKETKNSIASYDWNLTGVAARLGYLSCGLFFVSYFFSLKNNPFCLMLFSSHEKMNYLHRWLSVYAVLISVLHGILFMIFSAQSYKPLLYDKISIYGYFITVVLFLMTVASLPSVRRKFFEWFFVLHHTCSVLIIFLIWLHHPRTIVYMKACIIIYAFDRGCRLFRSIWNRSNFRIYLLNEDMIYMVGRKPKRSFFALPWAAGSHVYINIPSLSYWQVHPFTLASAPFDDFIELFVAVHSGFTERLANRLYSMPHEYPNFSLAPGTPESLSNTYRELNSFKSYAVEIENTAQGHTYEPEDLYLETTVFMDGPYGTTSNVFKEYSYVLLIAGGVGFSYTLPILRDLILKECNVTSITFIWSCRSLSLLKVASKSLNSLLHQSNVRLKIINHFTGSISCKESSEFSNQTTENSEMEFFDDRPDLDMYIQKFFDYVGYQTAALAACGSQSFLKRIKNSVNKSISSTTDIYQHYEEL